MTIEVTKVWVEDDRIFALQIPEAEIYKRKWVSLTDEDRRIIDNNYLCQLGSVEHFKAVEEKLKELNQ
jgi:hypothetical protein